MGMIGRGGVEPERPPASKALLDAAQDAEHRPVLIRGEPGLEKDNLAALVNYGSTHRRRLLVGLDAGDLQGSGRLLLDELKDSTLLVSGIDRLEPAVQQRLIFCRKAARIRGWPNASEWRPLQRKHGTLRASVARWGERAIEYFCLSA